LAFRLDFWKMREWDSVVLEVFSITPYLLDQNQEASPFQPQHSVTVQSILWGEKQNKDFRGISEVKTS
jgi:hypothetical protein